MATLAQFRFRVNRKLGLDSTAAGDDETLIDSWVNEAYEQILIRTRCKISSADISLTTDEPDYELSTSIMRIVRANISGETRLLEYLNADELARMRLGASTSGTPTRYTVEGGNLLRLYPTPDSALTLQIDYVPRPSALTSSSDVPSSVPTEFHKLIEWYALAEGADYDDDGSSGMGELYRAKYEQGIAEMKKLIAQKGNHRLAPFIPGGRRRRRTFLSHPSQDL